MCKESPFERFRRPREGGSLCEGLPQGFLIIKVWYAA